MSDPPLELQSATALSARMRRGEVSAVEVVDACAQAYERHNPNVNAVVTPLYDVARTQAVAADARRARGEPVGPLHGIPIALKDMTETAGVRTTYGSRQFAQYVPEHDALLAQRLKDSGAILVGKTNTPEFAVGINTTNQLFGTTRNPYDVDRSSGGSSGGSAVALATGMCTLAEGSDHGGSIRIPAALNNVVGLRTSPGRDSELSECVGLRQLLRQRSDGTISRGHGVDAVRDGRFRSARADFDRRAGEGIW